MKSNEFKQTDDAIVVDILQANSKEEALQITRKNHEERLFNNIVIYEIK